MSEYNEKELAQMAYLMKRFIKKLQRFPEQSKQSEMDKKLLLLQNCIYIGELQRISKGEDIKLQAFNAPEVEVEVEVHEEEYEQLALPGCTAEPGKTEKRKKKVSVALFQKENAFVLTEAQRGHSAVLVTHGKQWLLDLHKYMGTGIPVKTGKEVLAEKLSEWMCTYPLQLFLAMGEMAYKLLNRLMKLEKGSSLRISEKNVDEYMELMTLGLIDMNIQYRQDTLYMGVAIPEEVQKMILPSFKEISIEMLEKNRMLAYMESDSLPENMTAKDIFNRLGKMEDKVFLLLEKYGCMEMDIFSRIFSSTYEEEIAFEELKRFLYLRGSLHKRLLTGYNRLTKTKYVCLNEVNLEECINQREQFCRSADYEELSESGLLEEMMQKDKILSDIGVIFSEWDLEEEELERILNTVNILIQNGKSVAAVMGVLLSQFEIENPMERATLYSLVLMLGLRVPLAILKGYSRISCRERFEEKSYLGLFEESPKRIRKASLYELPVEMQGQLADLTLLADKGNYFAVTAAEKKLTTELMQNEEVNLFLLINRMAAYVKLPKNASNEEECKDVRKLALTLCETCRDSETRAIIVDMCGINGILNVMPQKTREYFEERQPEWDEAWEEKIVRPITRQEKIYPNDPCPCGSGKKYKKCCGRK